MSPNLDPKVPCYHHFFSLRYIEIAKKTKAYKAINYWWYISLYIPDKMAIYGRNSGIPHDAPRSSAKLQFESVTNRIALGCFVKQIPGPVGSRKPFNLLMVIIVCVCLYIYYRELPPFIRDFPASHVWLPEGYVPVRVTRVPIPFWFYLHSTWLYVRPVLLIPSGNCNIAMETSPFLMGKSSERNGQSIP